MKYKCPNCEVSSNAEDWTETEVYCEDCGSHAAMRCPECGDDIDLVFNDLEEVE